MPDKRRPGAHDKRVHPRQLEQPKPAKEQCKAGVRRIDDREESEEQPGVPATNPSRVNHPVRRGRHEYKCRICGHARRADIEEAFVNWVSPARIAKQYGVCRDAVYRHAHVFGLMGQRRRNVRAALERIIEKAGEVEVNASAVVSAASAYARINSRGEWVERTETVNLNALFDRMSQAEMEAYAKDSILPSWFTETRGATASDNLEGESEG